MACTSSPSLTLLAQTSTAPRPLSRGVTGDTGDIRRKVTSSPPYNLTLHDYRKLQQSPSHIDLAHHDPRRVRRKPSSDHLSAPRGTCSQARPSAPPRRHIARSIAIEPYISYYFSPPPQTPELRPATSSPSLTSAASTAPSSPTHTLTVLERLDCDRWGEDFVVATEGVRTKRKFERLKRAKRLPRFEVVPALLPYHISLSRGERALTAGDGFGEHGTFDTARGEGVWDGEVSGLIHRTGSGDEGGSTRFKDPDANGTSTFTLSKFKFPCPPGHQPVSAIEDRYFIEQTPPGTPAVVHYRGASFDVVDPHTSLVLHHLETPAEIDGLLDDYFHSSISRSQSYINMAWPNNSSMQSFQTGSDSGKHARVLYEDTDSAIRNILGRGQAQRAVEEEAVRAVASAPPTPPLPLNTLPSSTTCSSDRMYAGPESSIPKPGPLNVKKKTIGQRIAAVTRSLSTKSKKPSTPRLEEGSEMFRLPTRIAMDHRSKHMLPIKERKIARDVMKIDEGITRPEQQDEKGGNELDNTGSHTDMSSDYAPSGHHRCSDPFQLSTSEDREADMAGDNNDCGNDDDEPSEEWRQQRRAQKAKYVDEEPNQETEPSTVEHDINEHACFFDRATYSCLFGDESVAELSPELEVSPRKRFGIVYDDAYSDEDDSQATAPRTAGEITYEDLVRKFGVQDDLAGPVEGRGRTSKWAHRALQPSAGIGDAGPSVHGPLALPAIPPPAFDSLQRRPSLMRHHSSMTNAVIHDPSSYGNTRELLQMTPYGPTYNSAKPTGATGTSAHLGSVPRLGELVNTYIRRISHASKISIEGSVYYRDEQGMDKKREDIGVAMGRPSQRENSSIPKIWSECDSPAESKTNLQGTTSRSKHFPTSSSVYPVDETEKDWVTEHESRMQSTGSSLADMSSTKSVVGQHTPNVERESTPALGFETIASDMYRKYPGYYASRSIRHFVPAPPAGDNTNAGNSERFMPSASRDARRVPSLRPPVPTRQEPVGKHMEDLPNLPAYTAERRSPSPPAPPKSARRLERSHRATIMDGAVADTLGLHPSQYPAQGSRTSVQSQKKLRHLQLPSTQIFYPGPRNDRDLVKEAETWTMEPKRIADSPASRASRYTSYSVSTNRAVSNAASNDAARGTAGRTISVSNRPITAHGYGCDEDLIGLYHPPSPSRVEELRKRSDSRSWTIFLLCCFFPPLLLLFGAGWFDTCMPRTTQNKVQEFGTGSRMVAIAIGTAIWTTAIVSTAIIIHIIYVSPCGSLYACPRY